jgi:hypothetical protein
MVAFFVPKGRLEFVRASEFVMSEALKITLHEVRD